jgi:hypothetical protein
MRDQVDLQNTESLHSGLAEISLRQGIDPQRAVGLKGKAIDNKRASFIMRFVDGYRWAEFNGNKAWAHALAGSEGDARQALAAAWEKSPKGFRAEMAMLHYRSAQVERLLGDESKAIEHLRTAQATDPNGSAGRQAAGALARGS